jgi:hypothetical protein
MVIPGVPWTVPADSPSMVSASDTRSKRIGTLL